MSEKMKTDELLENFEDLLGSIEFFTKEQNELYKKLEVNSDFSAKLCQHMNDYITNAVHLKGEVLLVYIEKWKDIKKHIEETTSYIDFKSVQFDNVKYDFRFSFARDSILKKNIDDNFFETFFDEFNSKREINPNRVESDQFIHFLFDATFLDLDKNESFIVSVSLIDEEY